MKSFGLAAAQATTLPGSTLQAVGTPVCPVNLDRENQKWPTFGTGAETTLAPASFKACTKTRLCPSAGTIGSTSPQVTNHAVLVPWLGSATSFKAPELAST